MIGDSYGGNGKSLFGKTTAQILKTEYKNGRNPKLLDNPHVWDGVDETTELVWVDDCKAYFKFDYFFPLLTGDMDINPKNNKPYVLPYKLSPKFYFASNHALANIDGSTARRIFYIVFSDYYHPKDTDGVYKEEMSPGVKFKKNFYSTHWTADDWNNYYNLIARCIQFYLRHGKIDPPMQNVEKRNRLQEMGQAFFDWARTFFTHSNQINMNCRVDRSEMTNSCKNALASRDAAALTPNKFKKKLYAFCKYYNLELNPSMHCNTKDGRIIEGSQEFFYVGGDIVFDANEIPFEGSEFGMPTLDSDDPFVHTDNNEPF